MQEAVHDLHSLKKEVYSSSPHATATTTTSSQRHYSPHHPHHRASTSPVGRISAPHNHKGNSYLPTHLSPPPDGLPRSNSVPSLHQHSASSSFPVSPPHEGGHLLGVHSMLDVSPHQG